ncbi:hypothetical protein SPBR_05362 [Sporothrix brasiliensis 5110]|uniref:Uncharacterized protein n=1 Tax=Sporothrix brasiliensis 5110 TaxID=1398154 RepID=A0A0C2IK61_9PEZI|nr:uncharacterized protein SPBR_05362 [Sporothrix brasiliensis 5110]KIH87365.1 hypothetical protein SPBR_05362 [Sporothrix brasiliensis 5110]
MSNPQPHNCNITPMKLMEKIYQIIQILQTLSTLISEVQALCVQGLLRYIFGILFYFTPQLNPFHLLDAYRAATKDKTFVFTSAKPQDGQTPGNGGQSPPQEGSNNGSDSPKKDATEPPAPCGCTA